LNYRLTKLPLILLIVVLFFSCDVTRKLKSDEFLITEQSIYSKDSLVIKRELYNQLSQQVNSKLLSFPLKLHIYNLAQRNPEKRFINWVNKKDKRPDKLVSFLSRRQVIQLKNLGSISIIPLKNRRRPYSF